MLLLADQPSLGLAIGLPITIIIVVCCILWIGGWLLSNDYGAGGYVFGGIVVLVTTLAIAAIAYFPYKHDYHFWITKSGIVSKINNRFISDGDSVSQRFVVVMNGQPYGVDDTRASLVKVGDHLNLKCKKEYDFGSSNNGWACKWGKGNTL